MVVEVWWDKKKFLCISLYNLYLLCRSNSFYKAFNARVLFEERRVRAVAVALGAREQASVERERARAAALAAAAARPVHARAAPLAGHVREPVH